MDDCASIVFEAPPERRSTVPWTPAQVQRVEEELGGFDFLRGYRSPAAFEL